MAAGAVMGTALGKDGYTKAFAVDNGILNDTGNAYFHINA